MTKMDESSIAVADRRILHLPEMLLTQGVTEVKKKRSEMSVLCDFGNRRSPSYTLDTVVGGVTPMIVAIAGGIIMGSLKATLIIYVGGFILTLYPSIKLILKVLKFRPSASTSY